MLDGALAYINNHLEENISLEDLARVTGYSPFYLHRKLKEELHEPVGSFIIRQKMQAAAYLLSFTDLSVTNVRLLVGYDNDSAFSRVFKRIKGVTPREFRKNHAVRKSALPSNKYVSLKPEIIMLPEQPAVTFPCVGNYYSREIYNIWEKAGSFIKDQKLTTADFDYYGVFHDCQNIDPAGNYRYAAALVSKEKLSFSINRNFLLILPGGKFARYKFSCRLSEYEEISRLINDHFFNEMKLRHRESISYFKFNMLPAPENLDSLFVEWYLPVS